MPLSVTSLPGDATVRAGLAALRTAVRATVITPAVPVLVDACSVDRGPWAAPQPIGRLLTHTAGPVPAAASAAAVGQRPTCDDDPEATRMVGLVDLARAGDADAFGLLYDHYNGTVFRFLYYRVGSHALAEDLTSETFFRALRAMSGFKWQGRDFGAWLITIARNLVADHYKAGRTRYERATDDLSDHDTATPSPEGEVLAGLTNEVLLAGLRQLTADQQECLVLRFLQAMSIAETAQILHRSPAAIKQLQLRTLRNLAKLLPDDLG